MTDREYEQCDRWLRENHFWVWAAITVGVRLLAITLLFVCAFTALAIVGKVFLP